MLTILLCMLLPLAQCDIIVNVVGNADLQFKEVTFVSKEAFVSLFKARDKSNKEVALKIAESTNAKESFRNECDIYSKLGAYKPKCSAATLQQARDAGIPEIIEMGTIAEGSFDSLETFKYLIGNPVIVMELTGMDLDSAFVGTAAKPGMLTVTIKNWISIAYNMVKTLTYVHSKDVIHGNIKLKDFVFSLDEKRVLLTGFGGLNPFVEEPTNLNSRRFKHQSLRSQLPYAMRLGVGFKLELSRVEFSPSKDDDYESLLMAIFDIQFDVPWKEHCLNFVNFQALQQHQEARKAMETMIKIKINFSEMIRSTFTAAKIHESVANIFVDSINYGRRTLDPMYREEVTDEEIAKIKTNFLQRWDEAFENLPDSEIQIAQGDENAKPVKKYSLRGIFHKAPKESGTEKKANE